MKDKCFCGIKENEKDCSDNCIIKTSKNVLFVVKQCIPGFSMFLFFILILCLCISVSNAALTDGLKAYYSFTSDCTTDSTGQGETLTNNGASNEPGKVGKGCEFKSTESDHLLRSQIATNGNMFQNNFTVCFWYKKASDVTGTIINSDSDSDHYTFRISDNLDEANKLSVFMNAATQNKAVSSATNGNTSWIYHCSAVDTNGKVVALYTDGRYVSNAVTNTVEIGTQEQFAIGCLYRAGGCLATYYFNGILDEIGFWNYTLTATNVSQLYNLTMANVTYPFVGCTSSFATEYSITDCNSTNQNKWIKNTYDINGCVVNTTVVIQGTCNYANANYLNTLWGEYEMIMTLALIGLWLGLWIFGYHCMQTNNDLLGGTMIVLTIPLDLYFSYVFQESFTMGTGFLGIAFGVMTAWTFGVFTLIKRAKKGSITQ